MGFVYGATGFDRLDGRFTSIPGILARAKLKPSENPLETVARQIRTWTIALPSAAELRWKSEVVHCRRSCLRGFIHWRCGIGRNRGEKQLVDFIVSDFGGILVAETDGRTPFSYSTKRRAFRLRENVSKAWWSTPTACLPGSTPTACVRGRNHRFNGAG